MYKKKVGRPAKKGRKPLPASERKNKMNMRGKRLLPLTSIEQYKETRKEINKRNRDRSKAMERRIAQYLKGRRVPSSGASAKYKGDAEIPFVNNPGGYLVECKLSAQVSKDHGAIANIYFAWFPKIQKEAENMGMSFGILVLHFHQNNNDFVFISNKALHKIMYIYNTPFIQTLEELLLSAPLINIYTNKSGRKLATYILDRKFLDDNMINIAGLEGIRLQMSDDEYLVMPISIFRMITEHI